MNPVSVPVSSWENTVASGLTCSSVQVLNPWIVNGCGASQDVGSVRNGFGNAASGQPCSLHSWPSLEELKELRAALWLASGATPHNVRTLASSLICGMLSMCSTMS